MKVNVTPTGKFSVAMNWHFRAVLDFAIKKYCSPITKLQLGQDAQKVLYRETLLPLLHGRLKPHRKDVVRIYFSRAEALVIVAVVEPEPQTEIELLGLKNELYKNLI